MFAALHRLMASDDPFGGGAPDRRMPAPPRADEDELPYRVELWDASKAEVEQVMAVTASASIGYAAYYAATRDHPGRYITLRHKSHVLSRWNGPTH